jgi:hypothetical protein
MLKTVHLRQDASATQQKGTWQHASGRYVAMISCPDCGLLMTVTQRHLSDGEVKRIRCPSTQCNFKGNVILENWTEIPAQKETENAATLS